MSFVQWTDVEYEEQEKVIKRHKLAALVCMALLGSVKSVQSKELGAPIPIYSEDELIGLIEENRHLARVKEDNCQLVEDIMRAPRVLVCRLMNSSMVTCWLGVFVSLKMWSLVSTTWKMPLIKAYLLHLSN